MRSNDKSTLLTLEVAKYFAFNKDIEITDKLFNKTEIFAIKN